MIARISLIALATFGLAACEETMSTEAEKPEAMAVEAEKAMVLEAPAGLNSDELLIWNSLTESAKKDALVFIENGGTFAQFIAA